MRVLLIGPHWDTGRWTDYCAAGLRDAGHEVHVYVYARTLDRPVGVLGRVRRRLIGAERHHLERVFAAARRDNLGAIEAARRARPELTVVLKGEPLLPETVERLRGLTDGPLAQWCGDDPSWFPNILAAAHLYTRFFLAEPSYANDLAARGVRAEFLPHAADPQTWQASDSAVVPESVDVIFVGDARHNMGHLPSSRERVELVEAVARAGVDLAIWGRGWEKLEDGYRARTRQRGLTLLPAARVADAYRAAKVVLNAHHAQMREGPNMRAFEIPAAGAFQLSDYKLRMDELFTVGEEIAVYRGPEDLVERLRGYLADEDGRRAIGAAGRRRVLRDHTYQIRMRQLVERALEA